MHLSVLAAFHTKDDLINIIVLRDNKRGIQLRLCAIFVMYFHEFFLDESFPWDATHEREMWS